MSGDVMIFPETWEEFEKDYGFTDSEEIYTNGSRLIQSFRVEQWLEAKNPTWIPVISGRLPEIGDYVLVTVRDDYTTNNIQVKQYTGFAHWENGRILAWMPLPEPYKAGEEE